MKQIPEKCMFSPALTKISKQHYPKRFAGKVPLSVRMEKTVMPDLLPWETMSENKAVCVVGETYYVWVNSYGAVTAIINGDTKLGLKPDEFTVVEYHKTKQP